MNLLIEYEREDPSTVVFRRIMGDCAAAANMQMRMKQEIKIEKMDLEWCDLLISVRGFSPLAAAIMEKANAAGKRCVGYYDDDLLDIERFDFANRRRKECCRRVLAAADAVMCVNERLGEKYVGLTRGKQQFRFDMTMDSAEILPPKDMENEERTVITYAANAAHTPFFDRYIRPVLAQLTQESPQKLTFVFMGVHPELSAAERGAAEIVYFPTQGYREYRETLTGYGIDIGIAPLDDTAFCGLKYCNKFVEYTSAGILGVYSDCEPYCSVVTNGETGLLCANTPNAWKECLLKAIADSALRRRCIVQAQEMLRKMSDIERNTELINAHLAQLVAQPKTVTGGLGSLGACRCQARVFKGMEMVGKAVAALRSGGVKKLTHKAKSHMAAQSSFEASQKENEKKEGV